METLLRAFSALLLLAFLEGCSSDKKNRVWISYLPPMDVGGVFTTQPQPVFVAPFTDARDVGDARLLVKEVTGAERVNETRFELVVPLSELVHDHVRQTVQRAGGSIVPFSEAGVRLDGELTAFAADEIAGSLYSDLMTSVSATFVVSDPGGAPLWSDSFTGTYRLEKSTDIQKGYIGAMDALMRQLARSPGFQEALAAPGG